ncbi:MAG: beta-ketoacyl-ACP synthase, partial [Polyangia bacterium]
TVAPSFPVTAYSCINALGDTTEEVLDGLSAGRSGLRPCPLELPFDAPTGAVPGAVPPLPAALAEYDSRTARLAVAGVDQLRPAVTRAIARHGANRVALIVGSTTAGLERTERAYHDLKRTGALPADYDLHRQHSFGGVLEVVRRVLGVGGPTVAVSTACSASAKALGSAQRLLGAGLVDAVVVGGVDSLCQTTLRGFHALEVLSSTACRPLSAARNGTNLGEGAAYLLLERTGDARAWLLGVGESSDAYQMSAPHPEGRGALSAMREALTRGGRSPDQIDYINAHSPGTRLNDVSEGIAISTLFGASVPVASTKAYTGHMLGACGATEAVFAVAAIEQGWIPASLGADPVDATLGINVATIRQQRRCRAVLSNSFAFGGNNVSVLFASAL